MRGCWLVKMRYFEGGIYYLIIFSTWWGFLNIIFGKQKGFFIHYYYYLDIGLCGVVIGYGEEIGFVSLQWEKCSFGSVGNFFL